MNVLLVYTNSKGVSRLLLTYGSTASEARRTNRMFAMFLSTFSEILVRNACCTQVSAQLLAS